MENKDDTLFITEGCLKYLFSFTLIFRIINFTKGFCKNNKLFIFPLHISRNISLQDKIYFLFLRV